MGEVLEDSGPDLLQIDAIDDGVDEGRDHQEFRSQRVLQRLQRVAAAVTRVHGVEHQRDGEDEQRDEVRQTRLSKLPAVRARPERSSDQVAVGNQDESGLRDVREHEREAVDVVDGRVDAARQLHHLPVGAEDLAKVPSAERQPGGQGDAHHRLQQREAPGEQQQLRHLLPRHQRPVLQRLTDGQVAVVRHDSQTGEFAEDITINCKYLSQTAGVRNDVRVGQKVVKQLWVETRRSADPIKTQVRQKDVDGLMEHLLQTDGDDERQVDKDSEEVQGQGEGKVDLMVGQRVV